MNYSIKNNPDFISIVLPWFNRPSYIDKVLDSIHEHADYPFEIIISDDSSYDGAYEELIKREHKYSTLIRNTGHQMGLAPSVNRAISLASSKYIIFINSDCIFTRPCFIDIKNVLDKPYVGFLGLYNNRKRTYPYINSNGTDFNLLPGIGEGCAFSFRKEFWETVGGFNNSYCSGTADSPLQYRSWKYGYFRAAIPGSSIVRNLSNEINCIDGTIGKSGWDLAFPKIFKIDYEIESKLRFDACENQRTREQEKDASDGNMKYFDDYGKKVIKDVGINWQEAMKHDQSIWEVAIERDFIYE